MNASRSGRKPDPAVDTAISKAVIDLLFEQGFEMTFDDVAARAGVGRATVFRRFGTKRDMLLDAATRLTVDQVRVADTGSLRGDLLAAVGEAMRVFGEPRFRALTRRFFGEACRDPAFTSVMRANLDRRLDLLTTVLDRGVERGELPESTDRAMIADLFSGIIVLRLVTDTPLPDPDEIVRLVDGLLGGFAVRGRGGGTRP